MGWTLVVSQDERFQREAMTRMGTDRQAVGALGEASACSLAGSLDVEQIVVDACDEVGRQFLGLLRGLPTHRFPKITVIDPSGRSPKFENVSSLARALQESQPQLV